MTSVEDHAGIALAPSRLSRRLGLGLAIGGLMVAALGARMSLAIAFPNIDRPDEIYQTLEPAHRLVTGWGVVTWEWRDGIRSWLLPDALAGLMWVGRAIGLGLDGTTYLVQAALSVLSLGVVAAGLALGWRHSRATGAVICGALAAAWPDLVYFAPKALSEVQGGELLVMATVLTAFLDDPQPSRARHVGLCAAAGLLLGSALVLRFQLAPGVLIVTVWTLRRQVTARLLPMTLGALLPVGALGLSDWSAWGVPFASIWNNVAANVGQGRADHFGTMPLGFYGGQWLGLWGAAILPVAITARIGLSRAPGLGLMAAAIVISHSLIPHKEISFVYAGVAGLVLLAGLGTAELVKRLTPVAAAEWRTQLAPAATALWVAASVTILCSGYRVLLFRDASLLQAAAILHDSPDLCGLGYFGADFPWFESGGYTRLDRAVPIVLFDAPHVDRGAAAANALLSDPAGGDPGHGFSKQTCWSDICLWHRPGGCTRDEKLEINGVLDRSGQ